MFIPKTSWNLTNTFPLGEKLSFFNVKPAGIVYTVQKSFVQVGREEACLKKASKLIVYIIAEGCVCVYN